MNTALRLPRVRVALALAAIAYGIVSMACGSSNEQTREPEQPPVNTTEQRPEYGPYEGAANDGQPQQVPAPGTTAGGEVAATPSSDPASDATAATPPEVPVSTVRFAVDEAALEMAVPMARHVQKVGGELVTTSAVTSGDWFLENFVYRGTQLDTVDVAESVVLAMRHRHYDAELLVWAEQSSPLDAERYLDVVVDDVVARLISADDLAGALDGTVDPQRLATHLEGLAFNESHLGERPALQVDMLRTHPVTRKRQHMRLLTVRQQTDSGTVLVHLALAARRDDFEVLAPELYALAARMTLLGQPRELDLNPQRQLGAVTDQYGLSLEPLEVTDLAVAPAVARTAAAVAERTAAVIAAAATLVVVGTTTPEAESEAARPARPRRGL